MEDLMTETAATTLRRPFYWGIVVIVADDWFGELPVLDAESHVTADDHALIVQVRHSQDTDESGNEYEEEAETVVTVRLLDDPEPPAEGRREVFRGIVNVPSGRLNVGDAEEEATLAAHTGHNTIVVSVDASTPDDMFFPDAIWVDLLPV